MSTIRGSIDWRKLGAWFVLITAADGAAAVGVYFAGRGLGWWS